MKTLEELHNDLLRIEALKQLAIRQSWHNLVNGFDMMSEQVNKEIERINNESKNAEQAQNLENQK